VFLGVFTIGIQNNYILQVRYESHLSDKGRCSRFSITKHGMPKHVQTSQIYVRLAKLLRSLYTGKRSYFTFLSSSPSHGS